MRRHFFLSFLMLVIAVGALINSALASAKREREDDPLQDQERSTKRREGLEGQPLEPSFPPIQKISSIQTLLDRAREIRDHMGVPASEILVCLDLDAFSVQSGTNVPLEGDITVSVYQAFIEEGFRVLPVTARNNGKKHRMTFDRLELRPSSDEDLTFNRCDLILQALALQRHCLGNTYQSFIEIPFFFDFLALGKSKILMKKVESYPETERKHTSFQQIQEFCIQVSDIDFDGGIYVEKYFGYYVHGILYAGQYKASMVLKFLRANPIPLKVILIGDDNLAYLEPFHLVPGLAERVGFHIYALHMPSQAKAVAASAAPS